ncbi:AAC(3)-I family aminoglycoside N-acetyltransferase [Natronohydrobacter thiooxidans]|jgi:aminoglycoside 3-N-acetyltransferase I|uniref:AAC(3)-I family aminoglycoside N-acetyltransferase n=1 Tax=Natronohydrobacter thiooxidans TaxID=87172 RepID=UPI0008FF521D|nr:AAC(3)-I family aminoglycoside N-acetyltransferase [Natronohydrobacter thiooxidans]
MPPITIHRLAPGDAQRFNAMLDLFATAFDDAESYSSARPAPAWRDRLLAQEGSVALVAVSDAQVVGALVAYELPKFEQERREFYIYDLAVAETHRRRGIATALITALKSIAKARGGWVIYVQADHGDDPAIALYTRLGTREDVLHFDIAPD